MLLLNKDKLAKRRNFYIQIHHIYTKMSLIVKANLKQAAVYNDKQLNISSDLADELNKKILQLIQDACRRATDNGRTTVMPKDL
jgi:histone H3/H4